MVTTDDYHVGMSIRLKSNALTGKALLGLITGRDRSKWDQWMVRVATDSGIKILSLPSSMFEQIESMCPMISNEVLNVISELGIDELLTHRDSSLRRLGQIIQKKVTTCL